MGHVLDKLFSEIRQWDCLKWQFPNLGDFLSDNTNNGNLVFLKKYEHITKKNISKHFNQKLVDNQLVQSPLWGQRLLILAVVLIVILCITILGIYHNKNPDPYIDAVLSLEGDPINGQAIFQINCAGCHGIKADGSVGPSLQNVPKRKSKIELINQVIGGNTPPMPKFQPNPEEMADLLTYLEQL